MPDAPLPRSTAEPALAGPDNAVGGDRAADWGYEAAHPYLSAGWLADAGPAGPAGKMPGHAPPEPT